jgi:predicted nucleic acid-binding Zn ribbon protein
MAAVLPEIDDAGTRRRRVRNSAILWTLIAAGFYLAFIVMVLVRAAK